MTKTFLIVIGVVLVLVGGFFWLNNYIYSEKQADENMQEEAPNGGSDTESMQEEIQGGVIEREGTILAVDLNAVAFDGPVYITIDSEDGEFIVAVPSMGLPLCAASDNIVDVYTLVEEDRISVRGAADSEGYIVPCESANHYLRLETGNGSTPPADNSTSN